EVAALAARVAAGPPVRIRSTLRRTSSAASAERRSRLPSADRQSMTMFFRSTYPSSRRPWRNASMRAVLTERETVVRYAIRGILLGCCASAMIAIASSITATAMHRTAALFILSLTSSVIYHADRSEEKRYSQAEGDEVFGFVTKPWADLMRAKRARPRQQISMPEAVEGSRGEGGVERER